MRFHYKVVETRSTYHLSGSIVDDEGPRRQYERSFRTVDLAPGDAYAAGRTFITGLGVTASPGTINYLTLLGGELSELSGGFVDQHAFGDERLGIENAAVELHIPAHGAVPDWPRHRTALIGIGLRAGSGANVSNLAVQTVEDPVTDSALDLFEWAHRWTPELETRAVFEKLTTLPEGWLCNGFLMNAAAGDLQRCRADWGRFVPGLEVEILGTVEGAGPDGSWMVSGERRGRGTPPGAWQVAKHNPAAAALADSMRQALGRKAAVRVSGILWDGEPTAELTGLAAA